jgi:hypothetical protein
VGEAAVDELDRVGAQLPRSVRGGKTGRCRRSEHHVEELFGVVVEEHAPAAERR